MFQIREKTGFTLICASGVGSSHFTTAHGNYFDGATSAFSLDGLGLAIAKFRNMSGADGFPSSAEPAILLVPPSLEGKAMAILKATSAVIMAGTAAAVEKASNANIYAGRFGGSPVVSPWLEKSTITGYSTAYWYLLADPNDLACYEIAYLNGGDVPTMQYFGLDSESDTLGMTWRTFWHYGVAAAKWRAGVKCIGS
jgi:hypothetical protein